MKTQLDFISEKSDFLLVRLYPYLSNATAGGRKDMWRTMVCPLFNALLALLYFEKSETNYQQMERLWHQTFKEFMMIPKCTSSELVDEMIGINLEELITLTAQNSARKWHARCERKQPTLLERTEPKDYLKGVPKEWCMILKQQCSLCKICKNSNRNAYHMETCHGIEIVPYKEIWKAVKDNFEYETKKQKKISAIKHVKRQVILDYWRPTLQNITQTTDEKFQAIYSRI